ncbi:co-chaperone YbbN [Gloeocapsa sp. PCC 73106]|uniref:thioredoxin family protein n=1 Tax=Gloeocapsa sp. PCC 73106 TaxID=102232 RepID=UPI0002ABB751|nr:thioredoxin domain-containing protein [Gloeocapsa sp. PCC 73106]ELR97437.1 thioredoxin domain-containing protein [Gloeocapsa sp. PCC 73106]
MLLSITEENFPREILQAPQPVLVHFWAPWCGLCRLINPVLAKFESDWDSQIRVIGINADENFKLANFYRLTTLPTLILFDKGTNIRRIEGFQKKEDLARLLNATMLSRIAHSA